MAKGLFCETIAVVAALSGCYHPAQLYPHLEFTKMKQGDMMLAEKKSLENLLERIWNSGFIVQDEKIKSEMLDNKYGIFTKGNEPRGCDGCKAIYLHNPVDGEVVLMSEELFTQQISLNETSIGYIAPSRHITSYFLHELFHDFWYSGLVGFKEKEEFISTARWLCKAIASTRTDESKKGLLLQIGMKNPSADDFEPYEKILARQRHYLEDGYTEKQFFGTEMYSIISELAYERSIIVPQQMRKFYRGIIADEALETSKLRK